MFLLANFLASLRLGYLKKIKAILLRFNFFILRILHCFLNLQFITRFLFVGNYYVKIFLSYNTTGLPIIRNLLLISKQSNRIFLKIYYFKTYGIFILLKNCGCLLVSTSSGLLWHNVSITPYVGGEVLLYIN